MRRISTCGAAALILVALAIPASTAADPRPTLPPMHNCGQTPIEGHHHMVRITQIHANSLVGSGTEHTNHGCERARHIVNNEFLHRDTCVGSHAATSTCNLGQYGAHGIYYEFSCKHYWGETHSGYRHRWHSCYNQSTGAKMTIDWHKTHTH